LQDGSTADLKSSASGASAPRLHHAPLQNLGLIQFEEEGLGGRSSREPRASDQRQAVRPGGCLREAAGWTQRRSGPNDDGEPCSPRDGSV